MQPRLLAVALSVLTLFVSADAQSGGKTVVANLDAANWTHGKNDPAGYEGVLLRTDAANGGMDLLVRFPAGHVIAPHFHESNERIFVAEGELTLRQDNGNAKISAGGFAFLPAREVQRAADVHDRRWTSRAARSICPG